MQVAYQFTQKQGNKMYGKRGSVGTGKIKKKKMKKTRQGNGRGTKKKYKRKK